MRFHVLLLCTGLALAGIGRASTPASPSPSAPPAATVCAGGIDARMLRYPAVSATQIAFSYAGDIWVAPKSGGQAQRLSSPKGEESFPRFSPDGSLLAFSGDYDGNLDIYVMPVSGGLPRRLTYHGAPDRMIEWTPDGQSILFASTRYSEKDRFNQLFKIPVGGGLPEKLPLPYGEFGALSPDGHTLAYVPISTDFRTWKRYRGGMNPAIWLFDLQTFAAKDITGNSAFNSQPMWHGTTLYFLSDRDKNQRANLWAYDTRSGQTRQVTAFEAFDIHFPSIGPEDIVFENGGRLYLLNLATEKYSEVSIQVVTDRATLKPRLEDVAKLAREPGLSPAGKRAVFEARGQIFTVPAEHGVVRNLTQSPGVAQRFPAWSPDGKWVAYFTDRPGEYELALRPSDGSGQEQILTHLGAGFRYHLFWSPDSRKLAFIDKAMQLWLYDLDKKEPRQIDRELWLYNSDLMSFSVSWSKDSRWLAFAHDLENQHTAIALYDTRSHQLHQVTSGYYNDEQPVFDADGKYLFYCSGRNLDPVYSDEDETWVYPNSRQLMAASLRPEVPSLLAPRNDEETLTNRSDKASTNSVCAGSTNSATNVLGSVEIELADLESRAVILPPKAGYFADLATVSGKLLYRRLPRAGSSEDKSALAYYDFETREDKTILNDVDRAILSADGQKVLVQRKDDYALIAPKEDQKFEKKLPLQGLMARIDPVAEWQQIFTDAWRLERDYFYVSNMHGEDWTAMRQRYGTLLQDAVTRWDVNYVIGELIAELNSSHTYRGGGDLEEPLQQEVGYLGVNFSLENGAYRIQQILQGAPWDAEVRSPLRQPGVDVHEGDYLLAVNGLPLETNREPYAAFQGLADKPVLLTVNSKPSVEGARQVLVQTLSSEGRLRNLAWIEKNRRRVEEASAGQLGYVYVPDTARNGQAELVRQYRAQFTKAGLVIDERFNSGGQCPDRFTELLGRKPLNYWGVRDGHAWVSPQLAHAGPMAMLINGWSGSGGDAFPFYFKQAGLGPLIGTRTWGGLIGITGNPVFVDGGSVTVPTTGIFSTNGDWIIEGHGVDPDVPVIDDPSVMAKGQDPQLERAISELLQALKQSPCPPVKKPAAPLRAGR